MFIIPGFVCYPLMIGITSFWVYSKLKHEWKLNWFKQKELEIERFRNENYSNINDENIKALPPNPLSCAVPSHSITMETQCSSGNKTPFTIMKQTQSRDTMSICEDSVLNMNSLQNNNSGGSETAPSTAAASPRNDNLSITFTKLDFIDDKIDPRLKNNTSPKSTRGHSGIPIVKAPYLINKFLPDKLGFELFAEHLIKEYAIENLLFLIEVEKFKKNCKVIYGDELTMEERDLPNSLPPSMGLATFENKLKLQYCYLYHKYIDSVKAEFSVNVASRNRLICQQLYNEWYEISHGLFDYYDTTDLDDDDDEDDGRSMHLSPRIRSPRTPRLIKRFGGKYDIAGSRSVGSGLSTGTKLGMPRASSSTTNSSTNTVPRILKRRDSFPNTTIQRSRLKARDKDKDCGIDKDRDQELKQLKEQTPDPKPDETEHENENENEHENENETEMSEIERDQSRTKTISILPPLRSLGSKLNSTNPSTTNESYSNETTKSHKLSVTPFIKSIQKKRVSSTNGHGHVFPPSLNININEHSLDTRSLYEAQIQCEPLTDAEETPAPPNFLTVQITPQATPQATPIPVLDHIESSNADQKSVSKNGVVDSNNNHPQTLSPKTNTMDKLQPLSYTNDPLSPLALSPPISRRASHELSALPDDGTINILDRTSFAEDMKEEKLAQIKEEKSHEKTSSMSDNENEDIKEETETRTITVNKLLSIESILSQSNTCNLEESVLSKSNTNISSSCATSATTTISHGSEPQSASVSSPGFLNANISNNHYMKVSSVQSGSERVSISKSWSPDISSNDVPNLKSSTCYLSNTTSGDSCEYEVNDTPIPENPDKIDKKNKKNKSGKRHKRDSNARRSRSALATRMMLQKRTSASLMHMTNKVPRNVLNQRIDEMMGLMEDDQRNTSSSQEMFDKFEDDMEDTQAMIDALDCCLKDVMANLRDSFGRFVFTDPYKRWSGED